MRFAGTSLAVTSPLFVGIALPARVLPTGAPTVGLGRGALSGGGTRGVPGRQEWRGRRQADLRAGGAGGIPPSHPAREDAPYAAATPPLSWVSRRCPASRKRPGASAALFGGEADLASAKARAERPAHPAARCQSAARCDGRSARAFADARTVPPKNDADWMARCHTVPPRLSIPDFPMRGFVKGVRLRRTPSLPPLHLVPIRILSRRRDAGCLLKSVFGLPLMPRTHRSEWMHAVTGTGCKLTLDWRSSPDVRRFR